MDCTETRRQTPWLCQPPVSWVLADIAGRWGRTSMIVTSLLMSSWSNWPVMVEFGIWPETSYGGIGAIMVVFDDCSEWCTVWLCSHGSWEWWMWQMCCNPGNRLEILQNCDCNRRHVLVHSFLIANGSCYANLLRDLHNTYWYCMQVEITVPLFLSSKPKYLSKTLLYDTVYCTDDYKTCCIKCSILTSGYFAKL